jgi:hypothetical protein
MEPGIANIPDDHNLLISQVMELHYETNLEIATPTKAPYQITGSA